MVQGSFMALPLALCDQPNQSGPLFHVLEISIDDMELTIVVLGLVFLCFDLATYL